MKTAVSSLELHTPRNLGDALRLLHERAPLVPLAGCTDVYVGLNFGTFKPRAFLDLWGLDELRGIRVRRDVLSIGALATYTDLIGAKSVRERLPILVQAASEVGGPQIQNRGTLAGNIANASPAGDSLPVLMVAEALVVLRSVEGERRVPLNGFYTGYRKTVMQPNELIVAVEVPEVRGRQWFRKVGTRAAQAISKVVMAGVRDRRAVRVAVGSVGPTVVRLPRTEALLAEGAAIAEAQAALDAEIAPIDDVRSTATYRKQVARNLLARFWTETATARRRS
jgi:CO/xanthine dehydrogenase FAD-binding subunit